MLPEKILDKLETERGRPLTKKQLNFLDAYYDSNFDAELAAERAEVANVSNMIRTLKNEVLELIELKLVEDGGEAVRAIHKLLTSDEAVPNASVKLEAAKTLLDRIGIGKKEKLEVEHKGPVGLFVIPPKAPSIVIDGEYTEG